MRSVFLMAARLSSKFSIAMLLLTFLSFNSEAQSVCSTTTTYSGCAACRGNLYHSNFYIDPYYSSNICWTNAAEPRPAKAFQVSVGSVLCWAQSDLPASSVTTCTERADPNEKNVYRVYIASALDHLYTPSLSEANAVGTFEGIGFVAFANPLDSNMYELYRCRAGASHHFVSTDSNCEGNTLEGSYGWVSSIPRSGYLALHRFYSHPATDHLMTTNYDEGVSAGYSYVGVLGYVIPN